MSALCRGLWLLLGVSALVALFPRLARADDPDTLPSLDDSSPVSAPEAPPAPPVAPPKAYGGYRPELPIRAQRRLALLGEVGWNGIAGFGPNLVFNVDPHVSLDLGAGLSLLGWKVGARGRYNFLEGPVTPFLGVGVMGAAGFGDSPIPINDKNDNNTINIKVQPSAFVQAVGGVDWTRKNGFTLLSTVGYAFLLSHDPVQIVSGTPTRDEERAFDAFFRSSIVLTTAIGYSFR
jgi:hypothetical protein